MGKPVVKTDIDIENRTVPVSFSSDEEVEIYPGIREILSHEPGACDLSRLNSGAPLLFNHWRDSLLGVVENARIEGDGKGRAEVRFGNTKFANDGWQNVQDGILTKTSVGYKRLEVKLKEERADCDVYEVTKWQPFEISMVTVEADVTCGIGRSANNPNDENDPMKKRFMMFREGDKGGGSGAPPAATSAPIQVNEEAVRSQGVKSEQERVKAILAAGKTFELPDLAERAIGEGMSLEQFRQEALDAVHKRSSKIKDATSPIGMTDKEAQNFSFIKLFRALGADKGEIKRAHEAAAFELEACRAAAEKIDYREVKGTVIPVEALTTPLFATRGDMISAIGARGDVISIQGGSGYTGTGGNLVPTTLMAGSFIDILRNKATIMQLGTQLGGLLGNIDIPKQVSGTTGYWVGEDEDVDQDAIEFAQIGLRPKTVGCLGEITRRMLMQTSLGVEQLLRQDLALGLGLSIDHAGYYGNGSDNKPTGLKYTDGIHGKSFAGTDPTFAELVAMETAIAQTNADVAGMAYVGTPAFRGYAKTTLKFPTSTNAGGTIWEPGDTVNGYKTAITNQITAGDVFFGDFTQLVVGLWGGLEITIDPFTHSSKARLRIVAMQDVDMMVRRSASFVYGKKP